LLAGIKTLYWELFTFLLPEWFWIKLQG
jgi:hypothetical protein